MPRGGSAPIRGSAVVIDCHTGEMLAMVSMPAYDPNSFSDGISHIEWKMLSDDDHVPLMNKVLQGLYPPGSTVKPMNALALLDAGVDPRRAVNCSGAMRLGTGVFHCHKRGGHGPLDHEERDHAELRHLFLRDDPPPRLRSRSRRSRGMLGSAQKFDLPFASQRYGTVPDSAWKLKKYKDKWTVADSLNASIGQGYVLANPLQLAVMAARIGSGAALKPRLLRRRAGDRAPPLGPIRRTSRDRPRGDVRRGQRRRHRRRARLQVPGVALAAKTGTAQVRRITMAERASGVLDERRSCRSSCATTRCSSASRRPTTRATRWRSCSSITATPSRNLDTPLIGRDIMTYLFDRERALKSLAEVEPTWGGDIRTRMAAQAAAYQGRRRPPPPRRRRATEADADAATAAPAVEAATDRRQRHRRSAARSDAATGNGVAQTTGSPEPQ